MEICKDKNVVTLVLQEKRSSAPIKHLLCGASNVLGY